MSVQSDRIKRVVPSQTIAITQMARQLKAQGKDIISLSAGEPDFQMPEFIAQAAMDAIRSGETKYTDVAGTLTVRQAACEMLKRDYNLEYSADEICVSTGGKQAIYNAILTTVDAGDEVIIPAPAWVSYPSIVDLADGHPVVIKTKAENNFRLTADELKKAITPKTKWLILNSPCNPTGQLYTAEDLKALADVLRDYPDIFILTDDIYGRLVYDGTEFVTFLNVAPEFKNRCVIINGVSKAYAMTGWRLGFSAAPKELTKSFIKFQGQVSSNTCSISQAAAVAAFSGPQDCINEMRDVYQKRRDIVVDKINAIDSLYCEKPQGAFYVFVSLREVLGKTSEGGRLIKSDEDFVLALLEEKDVASVHGTAFLYPGYFRISYATSMELLEEACSRIKAFCDALRG